MKGNQIMRTTNPAKSMTPADEGIAAAMLDARAASNPTICPHTQTRREACACGACERRSSPDAKHQTNKRDVLALLDLIAGCIDNHPSQVFEKATWGDVGSIAHLRGRLMEIATGFALDRDADEDAARRRIEDALGTEDDHVDEALIDAVA